MKSPFRLVPWLLVTLFSCYLSARAQQVNVTSVTPNPVCAGASITATYSYTLPDPGTVDLYLNGPNTTNRLIGSATTTGNNGSVTGVIPADRATGSYTVFILRTSSILPTPITSPASSAFTVNALPAAPGVAPLAYCLGATGVPPLTATGQNLKWYAVPTGSTGITTAPTPPTSATGTINYYVSQTSAAGCEGPRANLVVTINPRPAQPTVVSSVSYCQNSTAPSLTSSVTSGSNLKWYASLTGGAGTTVAPTLSTGSLGSTTYYVSQTNGCESDRSAITVTIRASPAAPVVTTPVTYCQNQTATPLSATPVTGASLNWFGPANNSLGSTAPAPPTSAPGTTFYSVSQTLSGCTGPVATITVTINAKPAAPTTTTVDVCQGTTPVSLATGVTSGTNLRWYTTATGGTGSTVAPTPSTGSIGSTPYYVSQVNSNGCEGDRAVITYRVNAYPVAPTVSSNPLTYCQNSTAVPLTATPVTNATLNYYTVATGGTSFSTLTPSTTVSNNYYVSQTLNGCESQQRATINVVINALPPRPAVTTPVTYCQFAIATPLSATALTNYTLGWYGTSATGGTASTVAPTPPTTTDGAFTYYVSQKDPVGCESERAPISVTIYPKPAAPTVVAASACLNSVPTPLIQSVTATGTLTWYMALTGGTGSTVAPTLSTTVTGSTTYYVSQTSGNGCESERASITFTVDPLPTASLGNDGPLTCTKPTVLLNASGQGNGVLTYYFSPGASQVEGGSTATVTTAGVYSVTAITANGCTATASTTVTGDQTASSVSITPNSATLTCASPTVSLTAVGTGSVRWSTGETTPAISVSVAGTYSVTLTRANSCTATASTTVTDTGGPLIAFSGQPSSASTVAIGAVVTTSVSITGTGQGPGPITYQWYKDNLNSPVTAQTSATLTLTNVQLSDAGSYSVVAVGTCNSLTSTAFNLTVNPNAVPLLLSLTASPTTMLTTGSTTLSATVSGGTTPYSYVFTGPGTITHTSTSNTASVSDLSAGVQTFTVVVTDATSPANQTTSATVSVTVSEPAPTNTAPTTTGIANQSATVNQAFSLNVASSFSDAQTPNTLSYSATGLPAGLSLSGSTISGTLSASGVSSVTVVATDPGSLSVATQFTLTVSPASTTVSPPPTLPFSITGVSTVSCTVISAGQRQVSFTPQYAGLNGQPISFSVVNELSPTTAPGPYTLRLYTDNPLITLKATQSGTVGEANFSYNWLAACNSLSMVTPNNTPPTTTGIANQSATVNQVFNLNVASSFSDAQTPNTLSYSATGLPAGLSLSGSTISGAPSASGVSTVTVVATDPGSLSVSTSFTITVSPAASMTSTAPFAITEVTTLDCTPVANRININFNPRYAGVNGQPISFQVANELSPTTAPGPYLLSLYPDNPVILLKATQSGTAGEATFSYNWLAACNSLSMVTPNNTPPTTTGIANQSATVNQGFSLNVASSFSDAQTPNNLSYSATGLPAGLSLSGSTISGTPSVSGVSGVTVVATDPGSMSVSTSFTLTVSPASTTVSPPPTLPFSITGVSTVSCTVISAGQRQVRFTPQYGGTNGQPISFSVVNELSSTTQPGPYTLQLYTDNPVITLKATQSGTGGEATFSYNWLAACNNGSGARLEAEPVAELKVRVLGNPVVGETVDVEVRGGAGQPLRLETLSEQGYRIDQRGVQQAHAVERFTLRVGASAGVYLLRVSSPSQSQTSKIVKQ